MDRLYLGAERVSPSGSVTSVGVINQLGRPSLDMLEVLIREAVQNSWDARQPGSRNQVKFGVRGWKLTARQSKVLRDFVFVDCPPLESLRLSPVLKGNDHHGLLIWDRGTVGLGGPTRADEPSGEDEARHFVDFLRNVGQPPDTTLSGGTYGYGKAAFYRASTVHTILVHSRCRYKGRLQSRFIASALGEPYVNKKKQRFTGRFWWGLEQDDIAEPLLGPNADRVAEALGFPSFEPEDCGTSIMVLQPAYSASDSQGSADTSSEGQNSRTPKQALSLMAECLLWYFWPKMIRYGRKAPSMKFSVAFEDEPIRIPDPAEYPPLQGFVEAMHRLKGSEREPSPFRSVVEEIESFGPIQTLGHLALQMFPASTARQFDTGSDNGDTSGLFAEIRHHTALLRQPELVVKYLAGPVPASGQLAYAGVFITLPDIDDAFAQSEPPTHDDWVPKSLEDRRQKSYVKVALSRIGEAMETFAKPASGEQQAVDLEPLGAFAGRLGNSLLPAMIGPSAVSLFVPRTGSSQTSSNGARDPSTPVEAAGRGDDADNSQLPPAPLPKPQDATAQTRASPRHRAKVEIVDSRLSVVRKARYLEIDFSVKHSPASSGTAVRASARAVLDGMQVEVDPPAGAGQSEVVWWADPAGKRYAGSGDILVKAEDDGTWRVRVSMPDDVFLRVELTGEAQI